MDETLKSWTEWNSLKSLASETLDGNRSLYYECDALLNIDFESSWFSNTISVSGALLCTLQDELDQLNAKQRTLRQQVENLYVYELKDSFQSSIMLPYFDEASVLAEINSVGWHGKYIDSLSLLEFLFKSPCLTVCIVRLRRGCKALKRAMRNRQRNVFCGLSLSRKIWFLMHGGHPPKNWSSDFPDQFFGTV